MTKFEEIGVDRQYEALNAWQAKKQLELSCKLCCERGLRIICDSCQIQTAHNIVMDMKFPKDRRRDEEA